MPVLGNSVFPSHMRTEDRERMHDGNLFSDSMLRLGEVQELIYPDDPRSRSKKWIEYQVWVQYFARNKTSVNRLYNNCLLCNPLGSLADHYEFTLRADKSASNPDNYHVGKGAKVLLLCLDSQTTQGVILGGLRDQADLSEQDGAKDLGHHLGFIFNGLSIKIDLDGQLIVTYGGRTDLDGSLNDNVDDKKVGTNIQLQKDGSFNVSTPDPDDTSQVDQSIILDNTNRQILLKHHSGVLIGEATDLLLLGESFRKAEQQRNDTMKSLFQTLQNTLVTVATALSTAGGSMGTPISGAVAAAPQISAAGIALQTASQTIGQLGQALDDYEQAASQSNSFLSKNSKTD